MDRDAWEERAAIREFDGGQSRFEAETKAAQEQGKSRWEAVGDVANRVVRSAEAERAASLLKYDRESGKLLWVKRSPSHFEDGKRTAEAKCAIWNSRYAGQEAFTARNAYGYAVGKLWGGLKFAHRVIWLIETGDWPEDQIDHINGKRDDNRWINLRAVSASENMRNMGLRADNKTGVPGVYWSERDNVFRAQIRANGVLKNLGDFKDIDAAMEAREAAEVQYGYSNRASIEAQHQREALAERAGQDNLPEVQRGAAKEDRPLPVRQRG